MLTELRTIFDNQDLTMCDFPFNYNGVLNNQADYYISEYDQIFQDVGNQGKIAGKAMTVESNTTMSSPLVFQF